MAGRAVLAEPVQALLTERGVFPGFQLGAVPAVLRQFGHAVFRVGGHVILQVLPPAGTAARGRCAGGVDGDQAHLVESGQHQPEGVGPLRSVQRAKGFGGRAPGDDFLFEAGGEAVGIGFQSHRCIRARVVVFRFDLAPEGEVLRQQLLPGGPDLRAEGVPGGGDVDEVGGHEVAGQLLQPRQQFLRRGGVEARLGRGQLG